MRKAEILIYDVIGEDFWSGGGITAKWFAAQLHALNLQAGDELTLRINSPGGNVFDGVAIYNTLKAHPARKVAKVEGLAASAASLILQAADERQVAAASFVMIHRAWTLAAGDADELMHVAAELEKIDRVLSESYATRSGKDVAAFVEAMAAETWYTGSEAIEAGLADVLIANASATEESAVAAKAAPRIVTTFRRTPEAARERIAAAWPALKIAALATSPPAKAEGKALSASNERKVNDIAAAAGTIGTLAQEMLQAAKPKEAEAEESSNAEPGGIEALALRLQSIAAEVERAHVRLDTFDALRG